MYIYHHILYICSGQKGPGTYHLIYKLIRCGASRRYARGCSLHPLCKVFLAAIHLDLQLDAGISSNIVGSQHCSALLIFSSLEISGARRLGSISTTTIEL